MPDADIGNGHLGHLGHAARSQLHRWYPPFERPAGGVDNALDTLADDVVVSSGLGEVRGPARYAERVARLPDHWRNAHTVCRSVPATSPFRC